SVRQPPHGGDDDHRPEAATGSLSLCLSSQPNPAISSSLAHVLGTAELRVATVTMFRRPPWSSDDLFLSRSRSR
ncbi:hypothetical protein LINGRAHAP2_LOCUS34672, partial [Linum grandiflorum]